MEVGPDKSALRDALYEGFERPSPELRQRVLASLPVAVAPVAAVQAPTLIAHITAWLHAHWPALTLGGGGAVAVAVAITVILNQPAPPPAIDVYAGYADTARSGAQASPLPSPWQGARGVEFVGAGPDFDAGALRIENRSESTVTIDRITVDIGGQHFDIWKRGFKMAPHTTLILTQTAVLGRDPLTTNFDTSEVNPPNCQRSTEIPVVHVSVNGTGRDYRDVNRVLNTGGADGGDCGAAEGHAWERLSS